MGDKNVKVKLDFSTSPPTWKFSGDLDPTNPQVVQVPAKSTTKVKWKLEWENLPSGSSTPRFAKPDTDHCDAIEFVGTPEDPWASGSAPPLNHDSDTKVNMEDNNTAEHPGDDLMHYYRVNVVWNGTILQKDPEVEEMSSGGPLN